MTVAVDRTAALRRDQKTDNAATDSVSPTMPTPHGHLWSAAGQLALVDGVFAGVVGVYLATRSATVTCVAAVAAVVSAWFAA